MPDTPLNPFADINPLAQLNPLAAPASPSEEPNRQTEPQAKPKCLPVLAPNIPLELRDLPQWVGFQLAYCDDKPGKPGRWSKVPKQAGGSPPG